MSRESVTLLVYAGVTVAVVLFDRFVMVPLKHPESVWFWCEILKWCGP